MRLRNKDTVYRRGSRLTIYINDDVSDKLLTWINNQAYVGPSIITILDEYVNGELVDVDLIKRLQVVKSDESYNKNDFLDEDSININKAKSNSNNVNNKDILEYNTEKTTEKDDKDVSDRSDIENNLVSVIEESSNADSNEDLDMVDDSILNENEVIIQKKDATRDDSSIDKTHNQVAKPPLSGDFKLFSRDKPVKNKFGK